MLSSAAKNAIRATLYLAVHSEEKKKISAKKIAADLNSPLAFLAKLLQDLQRKGIVSSAKGPYGGFYMSDENKKGTVWNIINSIDGTDKLTSCFLGLSKCDGEKPCSIHHKVVAFRESLIKEFKHKTIEELAISIEEGKTYVLLED